MSNANKIYFHIYLIFIILTTKTKMTWMVSWDKKGFYKTITSLCLTDSSKQSR